LLLATLVVGFRFSQYFYSSTIGDDYSYSMPRLLDGYYWFRNNGIVPQWYTPSFCGGVVAYADAQSMYYSVFQVLTILIGPRHAIFSGVILYGVAGGLGMIWLLRAGFRATRFAAALGGVLFISNGFLWARAMIGHLNWIEIMLAPLIAVLLLQRELFGVRHAGGIIAGLVLASFVYAGALPAVLPALHAAALLIAFAIVTQNDVDWRGVCRSGMIATCVSLLASASKLVAVLAFVHNFPRNYYSLPGFDSVSALLNALARSLFTLSFSEGDEFGQGIVNSAVPIATREEWDFSVGILPALLILWAVLGSRAGVARTWTLSGPVKKVAALAAVVLLLAPLLMNFYSAGWNLFLKSLPIVDSMSLLVRFWSVYIPAIIVVSVIGADKAEVFARFPVKGALFALVLFWAGARDWDSGLALGYDPDKIEHAYFDAKAGRKTPRIDYIGVFVNEKGEAFSPVGRDDVMTVNVSQLRCYQPQFGYYLERFPLGGLEAGSIYAEKNGFLNLKNPACYTENIANSCEPGAQFRVSELGSVRALASYQSYAPGFSVRQRLANGLSLATILGALAWLTRLTWRRARPRNPTPQK
jgi:hypothetical protein